MKYFLHIGLSMFTSEIKAVLYHKLIMNLVTIRRDSMSVDAGKLADRQQHTAKRCTEMPIRSLSHTAARHSAVDQRKVVSSPGVLADDCWHDSSQ